MASTEGPAGTATYASASLYVGDLNTEVTEALLFEIFHAVGPVASVRVCRDAATRRSLGYAYVNFHRVDDAERALDTMNFKGIRGRPCRIMWSHRDPSLRKSGLGNIFVKNLAKNIDNKSLYDTFSMFGNILSCKVACNSKRESLGYGFVHYESDEAAASAIQRVDGKVIAGQKVSVATFKSKNERGGANKFKFTNIYVKNIPTDWDKEKSEAWVQEEFSKYGVITSSVIVFDNETGKSRGFGFINYGTPEEASAAVEGMNNVEVDEKKLYVVRAQKKDEREKELRDRFEQQKVERQKKWAGVNLYVKNLSDEATDEKLREEFARFGSITSVHVMRDAAGKSKGFGFVCFSTPEEATKSVTEMNGRMMDNKPLYVALAQRKETRRAQLEAHYASRKGQQAGQPGQQGQQMYAPQGAAPQMFYQGMPQRNFVYPQQMMPRRWVGQPGVVPPQMMGVPGVPPGGIRNYQLMPVVSGRPGQGQPNMNNSPRRRRGGPQGQQQGQPGPQGQQGGPQRGGAGGRPNQPGNFKYADNVRNRDQQRPANNANPNAAAAVADSVVQPQGPTHTEPLTVKALAAAPEEQKKQMIGERLFPLIQARQPKLAGKITGMLLEMDNGELLHLLESSVSLDEKVAEAISVLEQHSTPDAEE